MYLPNFVFLYVNFSVFLLLKHEYSDVWSDDWYEAQFLEGHSLIQYDLNRTLPALFLKGCISEYNSNHSRLFRKSSSEFVENRKARKYSTIPGMNFKHFQPASGRAVRHLCPLFLSKYAFIMNKSKLTWCWYQWKTLKHHLLSLLPAEYIYN